MPNVKHIFKALNPRSKTRKSAAKPSLAMPSNAQRDSPKSSTVIFGQFLAEDFVQGGGVAIFHLASERVVICSAKDRHGRTYYFLPKGRRDAGEEAAKGAESEGYEEVSEPLVLPA